MAKQKKQKKAPQPFWQDLVSVYFQFCKERFNDIPSFDGSSPRDLKSIIVSLRKRCEDGGHEWTYEAATGRLKHFLEYACADRWLQDNFLLQNINRQKDRLFFKMSKNAKTRN